MHLQSPFCHVIRNIYRIYGLGCGHLCGTNLPARGAGDYKHWFLSSVLFCDFLLVSPTIPLSLVKSPVSGLLFHEPVPLLGSPFGCSMIQVARACFPGSPHPVHEKPMHPLSLAPVINLQSLPSTQNNLLWLFLPIAFNFHCCFLPDVHPSNCKWHSDHQVLFGTRNTAGRSSFFAFLLFLWGSWHFFPFPDFPSFCSVLTSFLFRSFYLLWVLPLALLSFRYLLRFPMYSSGGLEPFHVVEYPYILIPRCLLQKSRYNWVL